MATNKNIQTIKIAKDDGEQIEWINIINAKKAEMDFLRKKFKFNLTDLRASFASVSAQRPKITTGENYTFMILHFPIYRKGIIEAAEIDFFIGHNFLVTVHYNNISPLINLFNICKKDGISSLDFDARSSSDFLCAILQKLLDDCYPLIDKTSTQIDKVEEKIFAEPSKEMAKQILNIRRNIINFRHIMQSHKDIIKKFIKISLEKNGNINTNAYYNVIEHTKMIWDMLENQMEMINILYESSESLLNYRLNDIIKTLTIFSVIIFPLTLLGAIFGMNTMNGMPFVDTPHGFWIIILIMLAGSLGMLIFFEKKKWL